MTKDLTRGPILKQIIGFAIPIYLGLIFQQFYNVVDTMIVGKFLGIRQLAGVGSTGSLVFMVTGFCIGLCSGFSIPVAQGFRSGGRAEAAQICGEQLYSLHLFCGGDHFFCESVLPVDPEADEYA